MKHVSTTSISGAEFRFAKHILVIGLFLLPILAVIDYKSEYAVPALAKVICAFVCVAGLVLIRKNHNEKYVRFCVAGILLIMSMTGAFYKLDSHYSLIWVPVLPVLFTFLVGAIPSIALSFLYLAFYGFSYLNFNDFHGTQPVDMQVWLTSILAFMSVLVVSIFFKLEKLRDESNIRTVAELDYLTQIPNRHGFTRRLQEEIHRVNRYDSDLSIILIDVDFFKRINDEYGHPAGDQLLKEFTTLLLSRLRSSDVVARWGGEEFIILTPETDLRASTDLAEFLRDSVEKHHFPAAGNITASFGVTQYIKSESEQTLISRADELLYLAKKNGRNKVTFSHSNFMANNNWKNINSVA